MKCKETAARLEGTCCNKITCSNAKFCKILTAMQCFCDVPGIANS
jgi:hypothetical protein